MSEALIVIAAIIGIIMILCVVVGATAMIRISSNNQRITERAGRRGVRLPGDHS